jgi:hypothetical protein
VRVGVRVSELVVRPVVTNPLVDVVLEHGQGAISYPHPGKSPFVVADKDAAARGKVKFRDLSPRENYTDRTTAACQRSYCQHLRIERAGSLRPYSRISRPEPLLFLPSSSSFVLTRLSGSRSTPTTSQKIW